MTHPGRGESSVSHTKTLISGRAQNQLHPPHIGGGLGGGGCFFASFFAPKKVRKWGLGDFPQHGNAMKKTFLASFFAPKKRPQNDYILHKFLIYVTFYLVLSKLSCTFARGKREIDFKIPPFLLYFTVYF